MIAFTFGGSKQQADERAKESAGCLSVKSKNTLFFVRNTRFIFILKRMTVWFATCKSSLTEPCQLVRPNWSRVRLRVARGCLCAALSLWPFGLEVKRSRANADALLTPKDLTGPAVMGRRWDQSQPSYTANLER